MYAKPILAPLDVAAGRALCCRITVGRDSVTTPLCVIPFCQTIDPCSVTVPSLVVPAITVGPIQVGPVVTPEVTISG